jgi:LEA14-like dessication related protein
MATLRRTLPLILILLLAGCTNRHPLHPHPYLRIWLTHIDVVKLALPEQTYRVGLRIQNPNSYPLSAIGLSLHLHLNDAHLSHGVSNEPFGLAALGEALIELDVVSRDPGMAEVVRWAQKPIYGSLQYQIEGRMVLSNDIPPVEFSATGTLGQPAPKK